MKTKFLLLAIVITAIFTSCEKQSLFNYPLDDIYGTWEGTEVYVNNYKTWIDLSDPYYSDLRFSVTFKKNGKYSAEGALGDGTGTYEAIGNEIITYVDGEKYFTYKIIYMETSNTLPDCADVIVSSDRSSTTLRFRVENKDGLLNLAGNLE